MITCIPTDFEPAAPGVCSCLGSPIATVVSASVAEERGADRLEGHYPWLVVCMSEVLESFPTSDAAKAYAAECNTCSECGKERR